MKLLLTIITLSFYIHVSANDTIVYINNNVNLGVGKSNISFLTPITYLTFSVGYENQKNKIFPDKEQILCYKMRLGINSNNNNNSMFNAGQDIFLGQYHTLSPLQKKGFKIYAGYAFWYDDDIYIKPDNTNNVLYLNINNKFTAILSCSKVYKNIYLKNILSIPLYGLYYGSSYSQNIPGIIEKESTIWDACKFGSLNINSQLSNSFSCDIKVKRKKTEYQTLRFEYSIEYAKLQLNNNVKRTVLHEFKFSTLINKSFYNHEF